VHGVHDHCGLADGECYDVKFGGGMYSGEGGGSRTQIEVCGQTHTMPFSARMCIFDNATRCELDAIVTPTCHAGHNPTYMVKIDQYGDGWGYGAKYVIKKDGHKKFSGMLASPFINIHIHIHIS
jgi:hypothetical protein